MRIGSLTSKILPALLAVATMITGTQALATGSGSGGGGDQFYPSGSKLDFIRPRNVITSPANGSVKSRRGFAVTGRAKDEVGGSGVARVGVQFNVTPDRGFYSATLGSRGNWSYRVPRIPSTKRTIRIASAAQDGARNISKVSAISLKLTK